MRPSVAISAGLAGLCVFVGTTGASRDARADDDDDIPPVHVGFYVQPQLKLRQNSPVADDEDGFSVRRTRLLIESGRELACGCLRLDFKSEVELFPSFTAQDAYLVLSAPLKWDGSIAVSMGQFKAPFSRETLVSDSRLQLVEKAQIASITPDRQVGLAATLSLPMTELSLGAFNGEGKNVADNADEKFMYVARLTFRPIGKKTRLAESGFDGTQLEVSGSYAYNVRDRGDFDATSKYYGVDGFASWQGASLVAEWVQVDNTFQEGAPSEAFTSNGFFVQGGYLLPLPGWAYRRFELAARVEEIDRNDELPIQQPGNPEQSQRYYTLGASYYHARHDLKVQLQASHIVEIEDETGSGMDATFDNDTVIVQITYRQ